MAIFMVVLGLVFLSGLPTEQYPDITPPIVEVRASYTGANAVSVEQSVATPLEQEINGVDNMIYMKSINSNDGTMTIQVSFEPGTDPDLNTVFTQNRVAAATAPRRDHGKIAAQYPHAGFADCRGSTLRSELPG